MVHDLLRVFYCAEWETIHFHSHYQLSDDFTGVCLKNVNKTRSSHTYFSCC